MTEPGDVSGNQPEPPAPSPMPSSMPPPAGWYPVNGEQRYWDGRGWTEHRAPASPATPQAYYGQPHEMPLVINNARTSTTEIVVAWVCTTVSFGYMLPWAIAATRGKSNSWSLGLVGFFLNWTIVGWFATLVMACQRHHPVVVHRRT